VTAPPSSAGRHRRPIRTIVATVAAAGLLTAGLWLAASDGGRAPMPTGSRPAVPAPPDVAGSVPLPATTTMPLVWPADVWWTVVAGFHLPMSGQVGPARESAGRVWGFAHTPVGAVFAALHLVVRTSPQVGPAVWAPTLRDQVVGPDAAAYADAVAAGYEAARQRLRLPWGQPLEPITATVAGVRVQNYTPQGCDLQLLIEAPDGAGTARAVTLVRLSWTGGDWRLVAPPMGDWATARSTASTHAAAGFTPLPAR
jgi:hypothetical protein